MGVEDVDGALVAARALPPRISWRLQEFTGEAPSSCTGRVRHYSPAKLVLNFLTARLQVFFLLNRIDFCQNGLPAFKDYLRKNNASFHE